jgi:RND family efflux transporter MFP subunit
MARARVRGPGLARTHPLPEEALVRRSEVAALAAALLLVLACDAPPAPSTAEAVQSAPPAAEPVVQVETARVRRGEILQRISAPGSLLARRESRIGPEVGGRIAEIFVEEGDRVAAGDPLFRIDPEPYELALHQAEAALDRARAERLQLEADLGRGRKLHNRQVLAETEMDQLQTSVAVAAAAQREAEEAVALAQRNLDQTLVRAPYDASVAARLEDEGTTALVQPQTIVLVLQETTELEAQATIPEVHFAAIREGDPALLHVEGLAQPIATEVSSVSDAIDPATRTFVVKMRVPNPERRLKAGVFARVEILPRAKSDVVLVPRDAIRREEGQTRVLAVREGRAVAVPVRLGVISEDAVEVLHGVRADDVIVVGEAARTLGPGMRVEPKRDGDAPP